MTDTATLVPLGDAMTEDSAAVGKVLDAVLPRPAGPEAPLFEAMRYMSLANGKRLRPFLVLSGARLCGGARAGALRVGAAIELVHTYSLIHDDLPAMDNDDLRRGRPTNHKVYGDALAILAGDALSSMAFEVIAKKVPDAALASRLILELALATGPEGMIGGQVLDTCHPNESREVVDAATLPKLQQIHRMKTGALIRCSCRLGALCAMGTGGGNEATLQAIDTYGRAIGLAFQIVDDILDVVATAEQMGKKTGKDAAIGKLTYPSLVGLEKAREYLAEQVRLADGVAAELGPRAGLLAGLAHNLAARTH